jgi:2-polyprenyl-6-methoxyphenol hydroxylase-like FAD-dependent oxidoreductase
MDAPIVIVGGGPVGLSLGLGLARYGVRSLILERNASPTQESRALVIWPRTAELLADWNAFEPLREAGTWRRVFEISVAHGGDRLVQVDFANVADVLALTGALLLPQSETERILRSLVAQSGLCELRTGYNATGLEQDAGGVTVTASDGTATHAFRAQYAVGCDGAHGVVRHALGLTLEGVTYRTRAVLSDEIVRGPAWTPPSPRFSVAANAMALGIEYAPNRWRVISLLPADTPDAAALDATAHAARLACLFGDETPSETIWSSLFHIHRRHAQHFAIGRVALAGDAAHLNSPAGGQGMNAGIQDAGNLAWKLAYIVSGKSDATTLLTSYDVERREMITGGVEKFTDAITHFGITGVRWFGATPVRALGRLLRGPGMQRKACRAIGMLGGRYTKSALIDTHHPLAGRRLDDLVLENGSRLHDARVGDAALVVVGETALPQLDVPVIRLPTSPKHWHLKESAVLVVRPDGCVAAVVEKPTPERIAVAWRRSFALV